MSNITNKYAIYKELQSSLIWEDRPFSKLQAWLDLVFAIDYDNIKSHSIIVAIDNLSIRWGWKKAQIKEFLSTLQCEHFLLYKIDDEKITIDVIICCAIFKRNFPETFPESLPELLNETSSNNAEIGLQKIVDYYCCKAKIPEVNVRPQEIQIIMKLVKENVPLKIIKQGIDISFTNFKPRFFGDKIKSFKYCEPAIKRLYSESQKGVNHDYRFTGKHNENNPSENDEYFYDFKRYEK